MNVKKTKNKFKRKEVGLCLSVVLDIVLVHDSTTPTNYFVTRRPPTSKNSLEFEILLHVSSQVPVDATTNTCTGQPELARDSRSHHVQDRSNDVKQTNVFGRTRLTPVGTLSNDNHLFSAMLGTTFRSCAYTPHHPSGTAWRTT